MKRKISLLLAIALSVCCLAATPVSTVMAASKKPKLNVTKLDMTLGNAYHLRIYNMKKNFKATFNTTDPSVIALKSVAANKKKALLAAVGVGSAKIRVKILRPNKPNLTLKCTVKVSPKAVSIKFARKKVVIFVGESFKNEAILKPSNSTEQPLFQSSDPLVAQVSPVGVTTGISPGTATITATLLSSNLTAEYTVVVRHAPDPGEDRTPDKNTGKKKQKIIDYISRSQ